MKDRGSILHVEVVHLLGRVSMSQPRRNNAASRSPRNEVEALRNRSSQLLLELSEVAGDE